MGGDADQITPVVVGCYPDARREHATPVHLVDFGLYSLDDVHRLLTAAHQHDSLNYVGIGVAAGNAEPLGVIDLCLGDVFKKDWRSALLAEHDVVDVVQRADEAYAPHISGLLPDIQSAGANVDVAVRY